MPNKYGWTKCEECENKVECDNSKNAYGFSCSHVKCPNMPYLIEKHNLQNTIETLHVCPECEAKGLTAKMNHADDLRLVAGGVSHA